MLFRSLYKAMPLPNITSVTDPYNLSGNYGVSGMLRLNRNQYDTKVNYNVGPNMMVWGKYSRMDAPVAGKYPFGDLGGSALGTAGQGDTTTQLVTAGFNKTFSPTFLMDGVFGYTRMDQFVGIPNVDRNIGLDEWKIPGTNGGRHIESRCLSPVLYLFNGFALSLRNGCCGPCNRRMVPGVTAALHLCVLPLKSKENRGLQPLSLNLHESRQRT